MHSTLLFEIGTEELPSSFVDAALAALPDLVAKKLEALRLDHGAIAPLGTPRRLAVVVHDLARAQRDLDEDAVGPPEAAAFKDGKPTRAAEAFASKLGVAVDTLRIEDRPAMGTKKAGRYVVGRLSAKGRPAAELLGEALAEIGHAIPFRKSMRWGDGEATFGRPVQWIVAMLDDTPLDVRFAGVRSGTTSRGHRFLSPDDVAVPHAREYREALRARHVIVDRDERERLMSERIREAAEAAGGIADPDADLVRENASLVEEPFVVRGDFDAAFLELPARVIKAVARGHQKNFCLQTDAAGEALLSSYLTVVNTALEPRNVQKGNDRVMRARLADAMFFFKEDRKTPIVDRQAKLDGLVFHNKLGTMRAKSERIARLAARIGRDVGLGAADLAHVARASELSKFDLVTLMVGEFPELQGEMGRVYALAAGEPPPVADAIRDHYLPLGAEGDVARSPVSAVVAVADRLDSLVGCFAIGLSPTGAADPFALRRACIGTLRTVLELSSHDPRWGEAALSSWMRAAFDGFEGTALALSADDTLAKLTDFFAERLRGLLASETSTQVADAVLVGASADRPAYARARARAIHRAVASGEAWIEQAKTVAKRLGGISKNSASRLHAESEFTKEDDVAICAVARRIDAVTADLSSEALVTSALEAAEELAKRLDAIFERTLVNDPSDAHTPKRLEVLSHAHERMLKIADFSRLP